MQVVRIGEEKRRVEKKWRDKKIVMRKEDTEECEMRVEERRGEERRGEEE